MPRSGLMRWTPLRKENPKRAAKARERCFGEYADWIVTLPCAVPRCRSRQIDPAHTVTRKRGSVGGTKRDLVPLCRYHHIEQEGRMAEFQKKYRVDLFALAAHLWQEHGATERYRVHLVQGTPAEVIARWEALARGEVVS